MVIVWLSNLEYGFAKWGGGKVRLTQNAKLIAKMDSTLTLYWALLTHVIPSITL